MADHQDQFYASTESDAFFDRWKNSVDGQNVDGLRKNKRSILDQLTENENLRGKRVLEVGCFIGDLLATLRDDFDCHVHGVESSQKACDYAKDQFNLEIECATLLTSFVFSLAQKARGSYDVIICDDVLSWMQRETLLTSLGVLDWLLAKDGILFLRDFSPNFGFAYPNHHWEDEKIYNFKQPGGHRQFFLNTGIYLEMYTKVRYSGEFQMRRTASPDSMVWADSVLKKLGSALHPIRSLD